MNMSLIEQFAWMGEKDFDTRRLYNLLKERPAIYLAWDVRRVHITERQLVLRVFGTRFRGYILITMASDSTYTVEFYSSHGKLKHQYTRITDESIVNTLDLRIEHLPPTIHELPDSTEIVTEDFD